jgi:DnaK suppressor protein
MASLDRTQQDRLEKVLRARQETLRREIQDALLASGEQRLRELAGSVHDAADDSVADLLTHVNIKGMDRDGRELAEVGSALLRLQRGTYGTCIDCGREIGSARLEAQPTALRCIECATRHERSYAHEQRSTL